MGNNKNNSKRGVYSDINLPQETGKMSNTKPNLKIKEL